VIVRTMTLADCDALEPLAAETTLAIDPRLELGRDLTRAWVAIDPVSQTPIGYALGWWVIDELQLLAVGTLASARRRGVARALLEHVVRVASAAGGERLLLEVSSDNVAAIALYESAGFRAFNVRKNYYAATRRDAIEMERVLRGPSSDPDPS
jgi:ribosomal-protein-alanine N-acetyltransferase